MTNNVPRLGLLVYATDTGLGNQTRNLYKYLQPQKTMLVDISRFNKLPLHMDWYKYDVKTNGYPSKDDIDQFLEGLDIVFICESPLNYYLIERANQLGVKTVLQYNYEFFDYYRGRELPKPTIFAGPTLWNAQRVMQMVGSMHHLPVPIDTSVLTKREITEAKHFVHIAGRPAVHDRNGTMDFITAVRLIHKLIDAQYTLFCQAPTNEILRACKGLPINIISHVENYADMYKEADILVLPRRYGGLCLPAQEAIGCGIPVMMTNIDPNNTWMPGDWLIPVRPQVQQIVAHLPIEVFSVETHVMAQRMADLSRHPDLVQRWHNEAKEMAELMSWEVMKPKYEQFLKDLL